MLKITSKQRKWINFIDKIGKILGFEKSKPLPNKQEVKNILILELWGIGDIVLATVGLQGLRALYPKARITLLAQKHSQAILENTTWADEIIIFKFPWTANREKYNFWKYPWLKIFKLIFKLRKKSFDIAVDARIDIRNNFLLWLTNSKHRIAYSDDGGGFFLTKQITKPQAIQHRVEKWNELLKHLGHVGAFIVPRLILSSAEKEYAKAWKQKNIPTQTKLILGIHPGAAQVIRRWPVAKYRQVIKELNKNFDLQWVIFGEAGSKEAEELQQAGQAIRVVGDLRNFLSIAKECDLIITNDSGPMHMLAAIKQPLIALFGPGKPEWIGPWGKQTEIILKANITCRGCYDRCKYEKPFCMDIEVEQVVATIKRKLQILYKKDMRN